MKVTLIVSASVVLIRHKARRTGAGGIGGHAPATTTPTDGSYGGHSPEALLVPDDKGGSVAVPD